MQAFGQLGVGTPYISEMPRLLAYARYVFLAALISLNKTVNGRKLLKASTHSLVRKIRANKIYFLLAQPQIYGQPGLVLAMIGQGYIAAGKIGPLALSESE